MWPWTPVPPDGAYSQVNSVCTLCPGGCGISVRKVDNRVVKINGMANHPVNQGGICTLGASGLQLLYGPARIETPIKKVGNRGEGKWVQISWEEALSILTEKLAELRDNAKPHTLACISGVRGDTTSRLLQRFLEVYGSPNFMTIPSVFDSYQIGLKLMQGSEGKIGFDFENSNYILSFGSALIEGWGSPVRMFQASSQWQGNATVVQIDSRLSVTAAKMDKWIPINPGTEADLALGICQVIISENLVDRDFIDLYTQGFSQFKDLVQKEYNPQKVSSITGIDEALIQKLAREFTKASKPIAICGHGEGQTPGSMKQVLAVQALNALVGNINQKGGVWDVAQKVSFQWPDPQLDDIAMAGLKNGRLDGAGSAKFPNSTSMVNRLQKILLEGKPYPINVLITAESDPLYNLSDTETVKKAFDKIPFIVSFSSYINDTALNSDLVLPIHAYLERFEDISNVPGFQKPIVSLSKPVVEPLYNTKNLGDVIIETAKNLGSAVGDAFIWGSYKTCLEQSLGENWGTLHEDVFKIDDTFTPNPFIYATQSGKFEFVSESLADVNIPGNKNQFPLVLIPFDTMRLSAGPIASTPFMLKTVASTVLNGKDSMIEINPQTAKSLGLSEGSNASLTTPAGSAEVKVHLYEGIMPGLVAIARGLGRLNQDVDKYLGGRGVNTNQVIAPVEDPISGLDAAWGIRAKLVKA
jgi:anaerobic selenocysteine-containing dehydrogenase